MSTHFPPDKVLFLVAGAANLDGTMDFEWEAPSVFETEKEALEYCKDDEHGCEFVVYRITPMWQRKRRMVLQKVKAKP